MRTFLFLLAALALAGLYVYLRLRPYIRAARKIYGAARATRSVSERRHGPAAAPARGPASAGEKLVRCASCGTWAATGRAVSVGGTHFCSHACLERSADHHHQRSRHPSP